MRKIAVILLLLVSTTYLCGQARLETPEIYFGVHGGVIGSIVNFKPSVPGTENIIQSALLSGNGGFIFRYSEQKCCGLQVELNYMQRGWKENFAELESTSVNYVRNLHYLELPLLMHIYFGKNRFRGFFNLGPQVGYCFSENDYGNRQTQETHQYERLASPFDWGLAGGLGMYARTKKIGVFQIEARFNYSFGNYFADSKMDYFAHSNPMSLSINLGYLWEFKTKK